MKKKGGTLAVGFGGQKHKGPAPNVTLPPDKKAARLEARTKRLGARDLKRMDAAYGRSASKATKKLNRSLKREGWEKL